MLVCFGLVLACLVFVLVCFGLLCVAWFGVGLFADYAVCVFVS